MEREDSRAVERTTVWMVGLPRGRRGPGRPSLPRPPCRQHFVLRLLQRHAVRADLPMQPQLVPVFDCCLRPALEPEVVRRCGMATQPERD
jgi:hypothetical protein